VNEIISFYNKYEVKISRSTIDWRIHRLRKLEVIHRISRGLYSLKKQNAFIPTISEKLYDLYKIINKEFRYLEICIWNTKWLNEFMRHQIGNFIIIIEVDKEAIESVFYFLRESQNNVLLNPTIEIMEKYVVHGKETIFVKPLISEAPILKKDNIKTAPIEKIMVDILSEDLFGSYQGQELKNIYQSIFEKYSINKPKMLRYAKRRNKRKEVIELLELENELNRNIS